MISVADFIKSEIQGCSKLFNNLICDFCNKQEVTVNDLFDAIVPYVAFIIVQSVAIYGIVQGYIGITTSNFTPVACIELIIGVLCELLCMLFYIAFISWLHKKLSWSVGRIKIAKRR